MDLTQVKGQKENSEEHDGIQIEFYFLALSGGGGTSIFSPHYNNIMHNSISVMPACTCSTKCHLVYPLPL